MGLENVEKNSAIATTIASCRKIIAIAFNSAGSTAGASQCGRNHAPSIQATVPSTA